MEDVEYRCRSCSRGFRTPLKLLMNKLEKGPQTCQYCRGELEYPGAFLALLANPEKEVQPWQIHCPICERPRRTERKLSEELRCKWCGMKFRAGRDPSDPPRLGPMDPSSPVGPDEVQVATVRIPSSLELGPFVVDVLVGRAARGELDRGELESHVLSWSSLRAWPSRTDVPVLPAMDLAELQVMVPTLYFGVTRSFVDPATTPPDVIIPIKEEEAGFKSNVDIGQTLALNAAGLGLLALTGEGFMGVASNGESGRQNRNEFRVRVTPVPVFGAYQLKLSSQLNAGKPEPLAADQVETIALAVADSKRRVQAYLALVALFGLESRGQNALRAAETRS